MDLYFSKTLKINSYDGFHLLQDHMGTNHTVPWDDWDFTIKFKLYHVMDGKKQNLGFLRLLVDGNKDTSKYFISTGEEIEKNIYRINNTFDYTLAVSLPLEMDYYHKLHKLLTTKTKIERILSLLCDASYFYDEIEAYKEWDGFSGSLMREGSSSEAILRKGHQIAIGRYTPKESFTIDINVSSKSIDPIQFYFDNNRGVGKTNINLLTGKNGVGKSFLLNEISEIVTGLQEIDDKWPYFHKLIMVAYSPFEDFFTKDELLDKLDSKYSKKKKVRKSKTPLRRRLNVNEYAYVGFRNESGKFNIDWPKFHSVESLIKILEFDKENQWWEDRGRFDVLKETLSLCVDFESIAIKSKDSGELIAIDSASTKNINILLKEASKEDGLYFIKNQEALSLSSGQKIYSYMIPAIVAEIENESLIILDEPELYLHPHLEVGLINMLKYLLEETSSYSIIATHSAILTREVEKRGVKILRKYGAKTIVDAPNFETYGEALDTIIGEVFDDYVTEKPFQSSLDKFIEDSSSVEGILDNIGSTVGDEALAYIISKTSGDSEYILENE
ncbi:ATP-binding protein [Moritella sp. 36]|uniref:AAA family ATPase n=1 Tax=Moritella sp. 36 TaxID=2746233 RepID=UPI001BAD5D30|nr:AAA family ATPase [Moritella sp. 36]QUM88843.1 ATP-binding protein [Moritella sp. 36]